MKRESWFDAVKFFAMWLVIVWHMIDYRPDFNLAKTPLLTANLIVGVNMPLFFMISGFFSRRLHEFGDGRKLASRLVSYFWPLAVFGLVFAIVEACVFHYIPLVQVPLVALKRFLFCGWFFYSLAICETITFFACRFSRRWAIVICAVAFVALVALNGRFWYSASTVAMIPFYWFGLCLLPRVLASRRWFASLAIFGGVLYVLVAICAGNIATNGLGFYWNRLDVWHFRWHDAGCMFARYLLGIVGSLAICGFIRGLDLTCPRMIERVAVFGTCTLGIYFIHGCLVEHLAIPMTNGLPSLSVLLVLATLVYLLSHFLVFFSRKSLFLDRFIWGKNILSFLR